MKENRIYRSSDLDLLKKRLCGKIINLAYGHFSVIHPGHIRYLKNSSKNADFLIVALQNDLFDNGTNRFRFPQSDRSFGILATNLCDFVVVLEHDNDLSSVVDFISVKYLSGTNYDSVNIQQSVRGRWRSQMIRGYQLSMILVLLSMHHQICFGLMSDNRWLKNAMLT